MKKLVILLVIGFIGFSVNAQEVDEVAKKTTKAVAVKKADPNAPVFEFEQKIVDYGAIEKGSEGVYDFKFKNTILDILSGNDGTGIDVSALYVSRCYFVAQFFQVG